MGHPTDFSAASKFSTCGARLKFLNQIPYRAGVCGSHPSRKRRG
jgi:hypothetical protein